MASELLIPLILFFFFSITTENGRLSYDNPNYQLHLNAVRLEDALNSNLSEHFNLNSALLGYSMDVLSPQISNMVTYNSFVLAQFNNRLYRLNNLSYCMPFTAQCTGLGYGVGAGSQWLHWQLKWRKRNSPTATLRFARSNVHGRGRSFRSCHESQQSRF